MNTLEEESIQYLLDDSDVVGGSGKTLTMCNMEDENNTANIIPNCALLMGSRPELCITFDDSSTHK
jgi:hypothetical protein